jgi:hypothetical protein
MGYNITELEGQNSGRDWPLIVTAVECPTCHAAPGEMCQSIGATGINALMHGTQRMDWHAERKQSAAHAWFTRDQTAKQPELKCDQCGKESTVTTADGSADNISATMKNYCEEHWAEHLRTRDSEGKEMATEPAAAELIGESGAAAAPVESSETLGDA